MTLTSVQYGLGWVGNNGNNDNSRESYCGERDLESIPFCHDSRILLVERS